MNSVGALFVLAIVAVALPNFSSGAALKHHRVARQLAVPKEFQSVNVENYLKNPRAVKFQLNCLIYDGPCDSIGKYLKNNIHSWLHTQCVNCDEEQKKQAGKLIGFFQKSYPKEWNDAVKKFKGDFDEEDEARFEEELGVKVRAEEPAGPVKPDLAGLSALIKETKETLKATKAPLILTSGGVTLTTPKGLTFTDAVKFDGSSTTSGSDESTSAASSSTAAEESGTTEPTEEQTTNKP